MEFSHHLFLLSLLLPLVSCANPINTQCSQNFTNNNILQDNINKVYHKLLANTPSKGYAISTIGHGNNTIYGLSGCRGDIQAKDCSKCLASAAQNLQAICANTAASRITYEFCFIRYDTTKFIGNLDISDAQIWGTIKVIADSDSQVFNSALWKLLNWEKVGASLGGNRFGMGKISTLNGDVTIYGMVQCTHDLQGLVCMECLEKMTIKMLNHCKNRAGCNVISSSCRLRYEIYKFLLAKSIPVYPSSSSSKSISVYPSSSASAPALAPSTFV